MGYETYFEPLQFPSYIDERIIAEVLIGQYKYYDHILKGFCDGYGECGKYYEMEAFMKLLSSKLPDEIFEIAGDGEETDDVWRMLAKNGVVERITPIVTWPEYTLGKENNV